MWYVRPRTAAGTGHGAFRVSSDAKGQPARLVFARPPEIRDREARHAWALSRWDDRVVTCALYDP